VTFKKEMKRRKNNQSNQESCLWLAFFLFALEKKEEKNLICLLK